jgi:hypothetical protein
MAQWFVFFLHKDSTRRKQANKVGIIFTLETSKATEKRGLFCPSFFFVLFGVGILLRSSFGPAILTRSATMMGLPFQSTVMESASHVDLFPIERIKAHTLHRLIDGCRHDNGKEGKYGCCLAVS